MYNHPSIVLTVVVTLVVRSIGHPHYNKEHGGSQQQSGDVQLSEKLDYQQNISSGSGSGQLSSGGSGGGSFGHYRRGGYVSGGSHQQQQYGSGGELQVAIGFSNKHVETSPGSQTVGGTASGYQQGGRYGTGSSGRGHHGLGGHSGGSQHYGGGSLGSSSESQVATGFANKHVEVSSGSQTVGGASSGYQLGENHEIGSSGGHNGGGYSGGQDSGSESQEASRFTNKHVEVSSGSQTVGGASSGYQQGGIYGTGSSGSGHRELGGHSGGSQHYGGGSQGSSSELQVATGFSNKHVEVSSGSQTVSGVSSGYQQGENHEIGSSSSHADSGSESQEASRLTNKYVGVGTGSQTIGGASSGYLQGGIQGTGSSGSGHHGLDGHSGGSQHYGGGSQGSSSELQVATVFANKHVEVSSGSQTVGGASSGYQQGGNHEIGSSGGHNGGDYAGSQGSGSDSQEASRFTNKHVEVSSGSQTVGGASSGHQQGGIYGTGSSGSGHQGHDGHSGVSQGSSSELQVATGFSNKHVEVSSGSQTVGGTASGYQQGGSYGTGSSGSHHGGGVGSGSDYGSQSSGHKDIVVDESSGFTTVQKNEGHFQNNKGGSSGGSGGSGYF